MFDHKGDLTLVFGKIDKRQRYAEIKTRLSIVYDYGDADFFKAARDYILERNTRLYVRDFKDYGYPDVEDPSVIYRLCVMREEATELVPFNAHLANKRGILEVASGLPTTKPAVIINGNQCFFSSGLDEGNLLDLPQMYATIADKCHGRLIQGGAAASISSDNHDPTTTPKGSPLAGPDPLPGTNDPGGKYVGSNNSGPWTFAAGQATGTQKALGGLSTNYGLAERAAEPHQMIGYWPGLESGKGCVFTATQIKGVGNAPLFKDFSSYSKVPALTPSADSGAIKLFILDCGIGSVDLMHVDPSEQLQSAFLGRKTRTGVPYYLADYLAFKTSIPRP
jgi:hypothetical protein